MTIICVKGGLGNQLFQYAFAKYLNVEYGSDIYFDTRQYSVVEKNKTMRAFLLSNLNLNLKLASYDICSNFITENNGLLTKLIKKAKRLCSGYSYYNEKNTKKKEIIINKINYFDGYWQDKKYVSYVLEELTRISLLLLKNNPTYKIITSSNQSCSIHIRRGDYVNNTFTNSIHGSCSFQYYTDAITIIEQKKHIDNYFIFTDDLNWAKEKFKNRTNFHFINGNIDNPIIDLFLMKSCHNQIISNSSFSCWASYLNLNQEKITISPINWAIHLKTKDSKLYDEKWILI